MVTMYCNEPKFQKFVRCLVAVPFLPLADLERAVSELESFPFDASSSNFQKMEDFKKILLHYFKSTWIEGMFPPRLWNCWLKTKNLTNNRSVSSILSKTFYFFLLPCRNEGFNSRLNRLIAVKHPNPNVLLVKIVEELVIGEAEVERLDVRLISVAKKRL